MTDTADPRIALMQKWNAENPELLAQAGLASSLESSSHLGVFAKTPQQVQHYDKHQTGYHSLHDATAANYKSKDNKKHKKNANKLMQYTKQEIAGIAKAAQSGALSVHGAPNQHANTTHKKKKNGVKYHDKTPQELSEKTDKFRQEVSSHITNADGVKRTLSTYFRGSDQINDLTSPHNPLMYSYNKFYTSGTEADFEDVYAKLLIFVHRNKRIVHNGASVSTGSRFENQDFHAYGEETRPMMQKAFIVKTLYDTLIKRYIKTIPSIKMQSAEQSAMVKSMKEQFKLIDHPYRELRDYSRALRIRKAEAAAAKKEFPNVPNAALRSEFDDNETTFSMATPYS
jgi:hypothetical protein